MPSDGGGHPHNVTQRPETPSDGGDTPTMSHRNLRPHLMTRGDTPTTSHRDLRSHLMTWGVGRIMGTTNVLRMRGLEPACPA